MSLSNLSEIASDYLIWDADAVLLRPIAFYSNEGQTLVTISEENHLPYFKSIKSILSIDKQVSFSFITECFMFNKTLMQMLIKQISEKEGTPWWKSILDSVDDDHLPNSGFSEYETYGNFVTYTRPNYFEVRNVKLLRSATMYCGTFPSKFDLKILSLVYHYVSFEFGYNVLKYKRIRLIAHILKALFKKHFS